MAEWSCNDLTVEDDYEVEMSFLEAPSPALRSLDRHGRVIHLGSFFKSLFPGLRLGYLVGPAHLIREARALRALMLRHPPGHLQRTVSNFLALGHYDSLIRRMRGEFAERHHVMAQALDRCGLTIAGRSGFGGTSFRHAPGSGMTTSTTCPHGHVNRSHPARSI